MIKGINESFKKMLKETKLPEAKSDKENLRTALELRAMSMMDKRIANLKAYEIAFQEVIEQMFPDNSWWEVTDCNIFMSLFNGKDVYKTIDEIIDGFKLDESLDECDESLEEDVNLANAEINNIIYNSMRSKTFAKKHLNDLEKYGIKVNMYDGSQGTELVGPNGKKLWADERATFNGPQEPGFDKTHLKPYLYSSDYDKKSLDEYEKELDYLNKLDDYGLAREYTKAKTLDDAKAYRDAEITRITDRIETIKQNIKDDKKHDDKAIYSNREMKTQTHNNPYKYTGRMNSSKANKVDFLTYLTKPGMDAKTKEDIRNLGLKTDTIRDYDDLKNQVGNAVWNLAWEKSRYGVKSDDEIENEVAKYKADLIAKNDANKKSTKSAEDRLAQAKQAKSDFVKSKLNKNEALKESYEGSRFVKEITLLYDYSSEAKRDAEILKKEGYNVDVRLKHYVGGHTITISLDDDSHIDLEKMIMNKLGLQFHLEESLKETYKADGMEFDDENDYKEYKVELENHLKSIPSLSDNDLKQEYREFKGSTHKDDKKVFSAIEAEMKKRELLEKCDKSN